MDAHGVRIGWLDLPLHVRVAVEEILGDRVHSAQSQPGGFSPGTADRVVTAGGRRAFVKAVSPAQNPVTPGLHRREIAVTAVLPATVPAPRLLGSFDDGDWVALVLTDVEGRHPVVPWDADELASVLQTCADVARLCTPCPPLPDLGGVSALADDLLGWDRLRSDPPATLDPWVAAHLDALCDLGGRAAQSLTGDTLVHGDLRADNVLLGVDGTVVFVDWPWAFVGPHWLDTLSVIVNVVVNGGHDGDALVDGYLGEVPAATIDAMLAGMAGYFLHHARLPARPGLPTVRDFQAHQGAAVLRWLRARLGR